MSNLDNKMSLNTGNRYNNLVNFSNSPEPREMSVFYTGAYNGDKNGSGTMSRVKNMRKERNVRNEEIHNNNNNNTNMKTSIVVEKKHDKLNEKNSLLVNIAQTISGTVSVMYISLFVMFIINKNIKWFYILILIFIINICIIILKIFLMRFNADFLYRPINCEDEHRLMDFLHHNFILEGIMKKIDKDQYKKYGFPSIHVTTASSILTMVYLYFPKYKLLTLKTGIIYMILLSISRIYLNCHTFIQVISGLVIGVMSGIFAYRVCN